jgi:DNA-binding Lrp family transcriptional regulator
MGALERLQRRTRDLLLLETIKRVGVANYSLLARLTGLNPETVRYKVHRQLHRFGLRASIYINYPELGLAPNLLYLRAQKEAKGAWLNELPYLLFSGREVGSESWVCLCAVPWRYRKRYEELLDGLGRRGLLMEYQLRELAWLRYPPFRAQFFDFDGGYWRVDWREVERQAQELGLLMTGLNRHSKVDHIDVKILKLLQEDPTMSISRIAKKLGANPRTVRYHHAEHVVKGNMILGSDVRWVKPLMLGHEDEITRALFSFSRLREEELRAAQALFNRIPFTWLEAGTGTEGGGSYFAFLDIPVEYINETLRYIGMRAPIDKQKIAMLIIDPKESRLYPLPDELYDPERGWLLKPEEQAGMGSLQRAWGLAWRG